MALHHLPHAVREEIGDGLHIGGELRPLQHFDHLVGDDAAELGAAGGADMGGTVLIAASRRSFRSPGRR